MSAKTPLSVSEFDDALSSTPAALTVEFFSKSSPHPLHLHITDSRKIKFHECEFSQPIYFEPDADGIILEFHRCIFNTIVEVNGSGSAIELKWIRSKILAGMDVSGRDNMDLHLGSCTANGVFVFRNISFSSVNCKQLQWVEKDRDGGIEFDGCTIAKNNFEHSVLFHPEFNHCRFTESAAFDSAKMIYEHPPASGNFWSVVFEKDAYFNNCNFTEGAMFNSATFKGVAIFAGANETSPACIGDFSGCRFESRVFFDNMRFASLVIHNAEFRDFASFKNVSTKEIELQRTIFLQGADFMGAKIKKGDRNSFRLIKNEFLKHNNAVEASIFNAKELYAYDRELKWNFRTFWDKLMLKANRFSNAFGQQWGRGFWFTFIVAVVTFAIYYYTLEIQPVQFGWSGWPDFTWSINIIVGYFLRFFTIAHDLDFMKAYRPNAASYLVDVLGGILIGYGIYQTVQAFRKYGK